MRWHYLVHELHRRHPRRGRRGLTLIEVLAGLALMATILVGLVRARSDSARQWHESNRRLTAIGVADQLLRAWTTAGDSDAEIGQDERVSTPFAQNTSGFIEGHPSLRWRTHIIVNPQTEVLHAQILRLEILPAAARVDTGESDVLAFVEILIPLEDETSIAPIPGAGVPGVGVQP